jgi:hypothetical protein
MPEIAGVDGVPHGWVVVRFAGSAGPWSRTRRPSSGPCDVLVAGMLGRRARRPPPWARLDAGTSWDPDLDSLVNVNTPAELADATASPAPEIVVDGRRVSAATLAEVGLGHCVLNAGTAISDPETPLVTGDALVEIDNRLVRTMIEAA